MTFVIPPSRPSPPIVVESQAGPEIDVVVDRGPPGPQGPAAAWGGITGTLSAQTDLQAALDGKAAAAHTHVAADISDSTAAGRTLLTAADASAQRAALGAQPLDGDLTALAETTGTNTLYYRSGPDTWSPVTIGANLTFTGGTLAASGGGGGLADGDYGDISVSGGGTVITVEASSAPFFDAGGFAFSGGIIASSALNPNIVIAYEFGEVIDHSVSIAAGASQSGVTKTINIGTAGLSGSTTNISIGSAVTSALGTLIINSPTVTFGAQVTAVSMPSALLDAGQVNLQGQGADPGGLTDGRLWYNSTSGELKFQGAGRTKIIDNQLDVPSILPPSNEYILLSGGAGGAAAATLAGAANRIDLYPYVPKYDISLNQLLINCTTAVAAAQAKLLVYASDANARADALILETGTLDLSTTGQKTATVSLTLKKGEVYWFGIRHSSTATVSSWATTSTPDINGGTAISTSARKVLRRTLTFATAAPSSWGHVSSEINPGPATAIWARVA